MGVVSKIVSTQRVDMRTRSTAKLEAGVSCSSSILNETSGEDVILESLERDTSDTTTLPDILNLQSSEPDHVITLASNLDPGPGPELYFSCNTDQMIDKLMSSRTQGHSSGCGHKGVTYEGSNEIMKKSIITSDFEKRESAPLTTQSRYTIKKMKQNKDTSGKMWFNMSAPHLTPQLKNDLHLLRMRNALDPSRHYKSNDSKKLPQYFQVGRILSSSADFYSSRIPRRQQRQNLVDELLSDEEFRSYHKKKYLELQKKFMSGTRRHKTMPVKKKFKNKKNF